MWLIAPEKEPRTAGPWGPSSATSQGARRRGSWGGGPSPIRTESLDNEEGGGEGWGWGWGSGRGQEELGGAQGWRWGAQWHPLLGQPLSFSDAEIEGQEWLSGPLKVTRLIRGPASIGRMENTGLALRGSSLNII